MKQLMYLVKSFQITGLFYLSVSAIYTEAVPELKSI